MLDVSAATPERRCSRTREAVGARRNSWPPLVAALNFFFFSSFPALSSLLIHFFFHF